jgi:hypothetical protein
MDGMSSLHEFLTDYELQIYRARERIRLFESGEMAVGDNFPPFKDWTAEAITIERQIIKSLEAGSEILRRHDASRITRPN